MMHPGWDKLVDSSDGTTFAGFLFLQNAILRWAKGRRRNAVAYILCDPGE
jgi:hypothetical protein